MRHSCAVVVLLIVGGCASHTQYRDISRAEVPPITVETLEKRADIPGTNECSEKVFRQHSIEKFKADNGDVFTLGVIELSDDGHIKNVLQRDEVFAELKRVARENDQGAVIVTFVHGWHHRAKVCDENVSCFRRVLLGLVDGKSERANKGPVFGIYIGWRGESVHGWLANLTFFDRKSAAHHVGGLGGRDLLLDLNQIQHDLDAEVRAGSGGEHYVNMVTVGHSFGGALVYSAMESINVREFGREHDKAIHGVGYPTCPNGVKPLRSGIGDLVVLVNPAFEAYRYRYFAEDVSAKGTYSPEQRPVMLTVASAADEAVGAAFPAGRLLWLPWHPSGWKDAHAQVTGLGHYGPYITHRLLFGGTPPPASETHLTAASVIQHCELEDEVAKGLARAECDCSYPVYRQMRAGTDAGKPVDPSALRTGEGSVHVLDGQLVTLKREHGVPYEPYVVAAAPGNLITGHNDIYNPNFILFLIGYVNANLPQAGEARAEARQVPTCP